YANGRLIGDRLRQVFAQLASATGTTSFEWASAELVSKVDGLTLNGNVKTTGSKSKSKPYKAKLLDSVPSGALLYASFRGSVQTQAQLQKALRSGTGTLPPQALPFLRLIGRLGPLFANENALYVRPGAAAFIPEITLVTQPKSTSQG